MSSSQRQTALWIFSAFIIWVCAFWEYLGGKFNLIEDAPSYYDHTKFLIENLRHGIFPLWDPFWDPTLNYGAPNDFFLRRIGAFNPFYLFILILSSLGMPFKFSYLSFLAVYYWGGMVAFYLLAMRIYRDRLIAYAGYLLLMFSALGTRLFDSYMMLITVPLIWFFYFCVAMTQTPRKQFFLGLMLSLMVLAGTYIPFYFASILCLFGICFGLLYFDHIPFVLKNYTEFIRNNKALFIFSLMVLLFSFVPTVAFFHDSTHGQVVLPLRHGNTAIQQSLAVPHKTLDWGAAEDLMYSYYFSNLKLYKFAVVYVPFFSVIIFLLGLMTRITRRAAFMFLTGIVLCCSILPHGLPIYDYFYQHLPFLKYFRNLHFFIWFFLIPLYVLLVLEHWKMFQGLIASKTASSWALLIYVWGVHGLVLFLVWFRKDAVASTYIMILLSSAFWSLMVLQRLKVNIWGYFLLTLTVLIQPLEAYYYLSLKGILKADQYNYNISFNTFKLQNSGLTYLENIPQKDALYYAPHDFNVVYQNTSNMALVRYLTHKIILFDRLQVLPRENTVSRLEHNFMTGVNSALITQDDGTGIKIEGNDPDPRPYAQPVDAGFPGFRLLAYDADHLRIRLDLPYEKFLVYNDSYDPHWKVTLNGQSTRLYEANGAFKGVWVPSGRNVIEFKYGTWGQYAMNILLSIFALLFLIGIIFYTLVYIRTEG